MTDVQRRRGEGRRYLGYLAAAALVLFALLGRLLWNGGGKGEGSLPPGFTMTAGGGETVAVGEGAQAQGTGSLQRLVAATVSSEGEFSASIAVLPPENLTGVASYDTLGSGLTDELISRLSRIRGLKVISRQSVEEVRGLGLSPREVADTLAVGHLLLGQTVPGEAGGRVEVRLVRVGDPPEDLWKNDYSLDPTNRSRAVEEITEEVRRGLLGDHPELSAAASPAVTESPGYVSYLAGNRLLNARTRDGLLRSLDAFRSAIAADSTFALAYAGLSSAYALSITYRYDVGIDAYAAAARALKTAEEAVRLDPRLAEGYAARGYISSVALAPAPTVHADFARAMELQPNAPNVAAWYANLLIREGFYDQALAEAQRAVELDPLSPARRTGLAYEALRARDYGLAIEQARTAQVLQSGVILPRSIQALALLLSGRSEECLALELGPHAGIQAMCEHELGHLERAERIADSLRAGLLRGEVLYTGFSNALQAGDLAAYLSWTGRAERALPWIHRAYALSPSGIDPRVLESGVFDGLLSDRELKREVEVIRASVWPRVQRELADVGSIW